MSLALDLSKNMCEGSLRQDASIIFKQTVEATPDSELCTQTEPYRRSPQIDTSAKCRETSHARRYVSHKQQQRSNNAPEVQKDFFNAFGITSRDVSSSYIREALLYVKYV